MTVMFQSGSPRKGGPARAKGAAVNKAALRKGAAVNQQTKKLVSQLVKVRLRILLAKNLKIFQKALKNRLGGSLAARRAAVATTGVRFRELPFFFSPLAMPEWAECAASHSMRILFSGVVASKSCGCY